MYEYDKSTNNRGGSIDLPLVLDGKSGKECIVVLPMDEDVYFSYLADRMPPLNPTPNQEKPFQYKLILRDSHDNHFTGGLNTDKSVLVDYTSLRYMSVSNTNIQNAAMLGRPKLGLFFKLYIGRGLLWLRFRFKLLLYFLGISSST